MDEWDYLPDGRVQVAMFAGYGVALAPPSAAALRILYFQDQAAVDAGNQEALQIGLTRVQIDELITVLSGAAKALDEAAAE